MLWFVKFRKKLKGVNFRVTFTEIHLIFHVRALKVIMFKYRTSYVIFTDQIHQFERRFKMRLFYLVPRSRLYAYRKWSLIQKKCMFTFLCNN